VDLLEFSEPGVSNYSTLLLSEARDSLYVGAREAIFELSKWNVTVRHNKAQWNVAETPMNMCMQKGKSKESMADFVLEGRAEDGRGKCPFDPSQSFTTVMVDGELYSGTAYNFLGSEPIISRYSPLQSLLRTEYSTSWLNEPSFVFADVIREGGSSRLDGEGDKIYYFFTEGDLGGQRTLQKKWTSFLKAKLVCSMPELNFVFNVVHDVFVLEAEDWRNTLIYAVFTSQ
ncbi:hypothetical protein CRUP_012817, partial [Coryphaenoides rupestris]